MRTVLMVCVAFISFSLMAMDGIENNHEVKIHLPDGTFVRVDSREWAGNSNTPVFVDGDELPANKKRKVEKDQVYKKDN